VLVSVLMVSSSGGANTGEASDRSGSCQPAADRVLTRQLTGSPGA
jgi:hypothetical protein